MASNLIPVTRLYLVQGTVLGFSVDAVNGAPGTTVPLRIDLPPPRDESVGAPPVRRFLMFRGIPDGLTLSAGFRTRKVWIVASGDAGGLRLNVPPDYSGSFSVELMLYRGETETPERRTFSVSIAPPSVAAPLDHPAEPPPSGQTAGSQPRNGGPVPAAEAELLTQGEAHLRNGNIVFARVLFEELAARGSARGAFAVAQTYDPAVLEQIAAVGIQGDVEQAKYWYRKAAELGNVPPVDILTSLKKERPQE